MQYSHSCFGSYSGIRYGSFSFDSSSFSGSGYTGCCGLDSCPIDSLSCFDSVLSSCHGSESGS